MRLRCCSSSWCETCCSVQTRCCISVHEAVCERVSAYAVASETGLWCRNAVSCRGFRTLCKLSDALKNSLKLIKILKQTVFKGLHQGRGDSVGCFVLLFALPCGYCLEASMTGGRVAPCGLMSLGSKMFLESFGGL